MASNSTPVRMLETDFRFSYISRSLLVAAAASPFVPLPCLQYNQNLCGSVGYLLADASRLSPRAASTTVLYKRRPTKRTTRKLPEQNPSNSLPKGSDRPGVMPLHAHRANPEDGSGVAFRRRVSPLDRRERRGKNGSVRPPGTHRPQCRGWRDGENHASLAPS